MPNPAAALNANQGIRAAGQTTIPLGFTPAVGNTLVLFTAAAANQTVAGMTEHRAMISDGEMSMWIKTADGSESTLTYSQNGPRALAWAAMELPAGTTFSTGSQELNTTDSFPSGDTTGLPAGNKLVFWALARFFNAAGAWSATWGGDALEFTEQYSPYDGNEGAGMTVGFYEGTATTVASTLTTTGGMAGRHKLIVAAYLPSGGTPANVPPVARAGADQNVATGTQVTISGSTSTDSDGTIASYAWTQTAGTAVTLSGSGASRTFTPNTAGSRTFQLTVTDDDGGTSTDTVVVNVTATPSAPGRSIFGASTPTPTVGVFTDGSPSIMAGDTFYQTAAGVPSGTTITGGRVWTPVGSPANVRIMLFAGDLPEFGVTLTTHNLNTTPDREVTVATNPGGWTEATWAGFAIPNPDVRWLIAYQFVENDDVYLYVGTGMARPRVAADGTAIALAQEAGGNRLASYFRIGTNAPAAPNDATAWYGTDTLVTLGAAANVPPTANAGADQSVEVNTPVTLVGGGSSDSDGTISTYSWTQLSGPTVSPSGTGANRTFTPTTTGTYVFGLTVTDDDGATSSQDSVTITVTSAPPVTGGTNPPSATNVARGLLPQGATSITPSFTPTSGRVLMLFVSAAATNTIPGWSKARTTLQEVDMSMFTKTADGSENSIPFTQNAPRSVAYTLVEFPAGTTVSTGDGSAGQSDTISAAPTQGFPAGVNKVAFWAVSRATSSASPSMVGAWSGDATEMTEIVSAHEGAGLWLGFYEGTQVNLTPTLNTSSSTGFTNMRHVIIVAATPPAVAANVGPTANAGNDQTVGINTQVTLNGGGSTDSDGTIASYVWSQIAGTGVTLSGSGATRTFTATTAGSRTFQLTVTDDDGATASDTVVVNVTSSNAPPVANAGTDQTVTVGTQVSLSGFSSSDSDGTIASYSWTQTGGSTVTLTGTGMNRTFTPTTSGARTFQLTVTDDDGSTATDTVVITVNDPASNYGSTVASENTRTGDPSTQWWDGLSPLGLPSFPRRTYYAPGETARFSVDCTTAFNITIHRLGHYNGNGARVVQTAYAGTPATQPAPVAITGGNGAVTCAAWSQNAEWAVPGDALPGWYMATFRRTSDSQHGYALFMVSDSGAKRPTLIVTGDATWHAAYNGFGGNNVYGANVAIGSIGARAFCSTYDKPVLTHAHVPQTHFFNNSYPYLAWSERMGYDAGVATIEQIKDNPSILDGRELIVWVGHNEYVPQQVMDKTKSLLVAGQNMLNIAGNDFFWRVKFTDGAFGSATNGRVMWCKKDTMSGPSSGPNAVPAHVAGQPFTTAADWTGTWQDTRWTLREPSEDFFGDQFIANGIRADSVKVPASMKNNPAWRNCPGVLALQTGQDYTFAAGTLGMEWDRPMMANPNVEQHLFSSTEIDLVSNAADANGETYGQTSNDTIHGFAMVKKGEGYVANFNSDQWAWALSQRHLRGSAAADNNAMQMMLNVISDLGVQPTSSSVTAAGLTVPTPVSLAEYGFDVTTDPGGDPGGGGTPTSPTWQELIDLGYKPHITVLL